MKVCGVIVTYGNRFKYLKQVIDAALKQGVHKVIVIDNNSEIESRDKLRKYEKLLNGKIKVSYLDDNYGSAGGYKRGLEEAYKDSECEFIWLLDDDNKPMRNALKSLLNFWNSLKVKNKEGKIVLLSYRAKREQLVKESVICNRPELVLGPKNSFLGFYVKDFPKKIYKYIRRKFGLGSNAEKEINNNINFGVVPVAPYGGLFIHKNILNKIGFPNEEFYLYADDYEWTYRITRIGGKIYLILDSEIDDLELSWNVPKSVKQTAFSIISKGDPQKVYYGVRNETFFGVNNLVDNKIIYWINIFVYLLLISFSSTKNIKLIVKAIKDGYKGKLGKVEVLK